jgi:large subunit ribosomal protein L15
MQLTDLRPVEGSRRKQKSFGRGRASGHGKTCTRGHNGQGQRSGEARRFGFEGGQTPLFRRLPKIHNFDQVINREWVEVNVGALNALPANTEVTPESLVEHKLLRKLSTGLRILGNGELKVALKVKAHHVSAGAKAKIEAVGGTITLIQAAEPTRGRRVVKKKSKSGKPAAKPEAE